ncbi:MAG: altronate oxidoreductase, partial [Bacteroidetes bacterium]
EKEGLYPYGDALCIRSEPFLLWAIEGGPEVGRKLSFAQADPRLIIAPDITPFREQKLRILNGGHTISVCLAYLLGLRTVGQMMAHPEMGAFVERVIMQEIEPTLGFDATDFAKAVLARFRNPYIEHRLLSITLQCSSKMRQRNVATLIRYQHLRDEAPPLMCLGLAAWLLFTRPLRYENNTWTATDPEGQPYPLQDDFAPFFHEQWAALPDSSEHSLSQLVQHVWANEALTDPGLRENPAIAASVACRLWELIHLGPAQTLKQLLDS